LAVPGIARAGQAEEGLFSEEDVKNQQAHAKINKLSMPLQHKTFSPMGGSPSAPSGDSFLSSATGHPGKGSWHGKGKGAGKGWPGRGHGKGFQGYQGYQASNSFGASSSSWRARGKGKGTQGMSSQPGHEGRQGHGAQRNDHEGTSDEPSTVAGKVPSASELIEPISPSEKLPAVVAEPCPLCSV
jgi:hypothetical protein